MTFSENVTNIVDDLELDKPYDKSIIKHRFLDEISYYENKRDHTKKYYNMFRFIVTTGSILLPAILSLIIPVISSGLIIVLIKRSLVSFYL